MEKTLRKCGSSHSHTNSDINSLPFLIPKQYQINPNHLPELDYHLDIHRFNYTFKTENAVLSSKKAREAAEQEAAEQAAAEQAAAEQAAAEMAAAEMAAEQAAGVSEDEVEVLPEPHPTNPFLAVSGEVLVPTAATYVDSTSTLSQSADNHDILNDFDVQNSNPFDGTELQSLSNFDALKSVLAPTPTHDFSLFENRAVPPGTDNGAVLAGTDNGAVPPSTDNGCDTLYTDVVREKNPPPSNQEPSEPVYSVVNKPPAIIKSKKASSDTLPMSNGPQIHSTFTAVRTSPSFDVDYSSSPPGYSPPPPYSQSAAPTCSPFPKIPEEIVARAMQRLEHNQEKCFDFLTEVLEMMTKYDCTADIAEAVSLLESEVGMREETITLITQFSELGFSIDQIVRGLKQHPDDRDALLDFLCTTS